jgi:hypothetical protein
MKRSFSKQSFSSKKLNDVDIIDINRLYITIIGSCIEKGVVSFLDYKITFSAVMIEHNVD